jgi:hypothetical protein
VRVAVVSAVFGGYDEPVWVQQTVDCHYVMVTDGMVNVPRQFEHVRVDRGSFDPRLAGKFPKCRPWEYTDADLFVWLDGSIIPDAGLVERMIADLGDGDVAFHPHPDRTSIVSEARASLRLPKYESHDVMSQAQAYVDAGHPDDWGLWAAGLFIWRDLMRVRQLGQLWLDEICRWTVQDQLPLPVVLRRCEIDVRSLSGGLRGNRLFKIRKHADRS